MPTGAINARGHFAPWVGWGMESFCAAAVFEIMRIWTRAITITTGFRHMNQSRKRAASRQWASVSWTGLLIGAISMTACNESRITGTPIPDLGASHPGFDTSIYPGDAAMGAWLKPASPYEWVGYYLQAPCHRDPSWMGKRAALTSMGWGLAVLFVGQ